MAERSLILGVVEVAVAALRGVAIGTGGIGGSTSAGRGYGSRASKRSAEGDMDPPIVEEVAARECLVNMTATDAAGAVLSRLISLVPAGGSEVPLPQVVDCLAAVAVRSPLIFVPKLSQFLHRLIPVLALIQQRQKTAEKEAVCAAFVSFAGAIEIYNSNSHQDPGSSAMNVLESTYASDMYSILSFVQETWRDKQGIATVGALVGVIPKTQVLPVVLVQIDRLLASFRQMVGKKSYEGAEVTMTALTSMFRASRFVFRADDRYGDMVRRVIDAILGFVTLPQDVALMTRLFNACMSCISELVSTEGGNSHAITAILTIIGHMEHAGTVPSSASSGPASNKQLGVLRILRYLVIHCKDVAYLCASKMIVSLQVIGQDRQPVDCRVSLAFVQVIMAMAERGYLHNQGSSLLLGAVIYYASGQVVSTSASNKFENMPDGVTADELASNAGRALRRMAEYFPAARCALWPYLLQEPGHLLNGTSLVIDLAYTVAAAIDKDQEETWRVTVRKDGSRKASDAYKALPLVAANESQLPLSHLKDATTVMAPEKLLTILLLLSCDPKCRKSSLGLLQLLMHHIFEVQQHLRDGWAEAIPVMLQVIDEASECALDSQCAAVPLGSTRAGSGAREQDVAGGTHVLEALEALSGDEGSFEDVAGLTCATVWMDHVLRFAKLTGKRATEALAIALVTQTCTLLKELSAARKKGQCREYVCYAVEVLGALLPCCPKPGVAESAVADMMTLVGDYEDSELLSALSRGLGKAAGVYIDLCVQAVLGVVKRDMMKSSSGFLGFNKTTVVRQSVMGFIAQAFGLIAFHGPVRDVEARVTQIMLPKLISMVPHVSEVSVKVCMAQAINFVARAFHPGHGASVSRACQELASRTELINIVLRFTGYPTFGPLSTDKEGLPVEAIADHVTRERAAGLETEVMMRSLDALVSLALLPPALPDGFAGAMARVACDFFHGVHGRSSTELRRVDVSVMTLFSALIASCPRRHTLLELLERFDEFTRRGEYRERALRVVLHIVCKFIDIKSVEEVPRLEDAFIGIGTVIGRLAGRATDPVLDVRLDVYRVFSRLFFLEAMMTQHVVNATAPAVCSKLDRLIDKLSDEDARSYSNDPDVLSSISKRVASIISAAVNRFEVPNLLKALVIYGLGEEQQEFSRGVVVVVLERVIKDHSDVVRSHVSDFVSVLVRTVEAHQHEWVDDVEVGQTSLKKTIRGALQCVIVLAQHVDLELTISALMACGTPLPSVVREAFKLLGSTVIQTKVVVQLADTLNFRPLSEKVVVGAGARAGSGDTAAESSVHVAPQWMLAGTEALGAILSSAPMEEVVEMHFVSIFGTLLLRCGTAGLVPSGAGGSADGGAGAAASMRILLERASLGEDVKEELEARDVYAMMSDPVQCVQAVGIIARCVARADRDIIPGMLKFLKRFLERDCIPHRLVVIEVIGFLMVEIVGHHGLESGAGGGNGSDDEGGGSDGGDTPYCKDGTPKEVVWSEDEQTLLHSCVDCLVIEGRSQYQCLVVAAVNALARLVNIGAAIDRVMSRVIGVLQHVLSVSAGGHMFDASGNDALCPVVGPEEGRLAALKALARILPVASGSAVSYAVVDIVTCASQAAHSSRLALRAAACLLLATVCRSFGDDTAVRGLLARSVHKLIGHVMVHLVDDSTMVVAAAMECIQTTKSLVNATDAPTTFVDDAGDGGKRGKTKGKKDKAGQGGAGNVDGGDDDSSQRVDPDTMSISEFVSQRVFDTTLTSSSSARSRAADTMAAYSRCILRNAPDCVQLYLTEVVAQSTVELPFVKEGAFLLARSFMLSIDELSSSRRRKISFTRVVDMLREELATSLDPAVRRAAAHALGAAHAVVG